MHPAFDGIVDYAGLFPPASCTMAEAVANYAAYRAGTDRRMLGRFVVAAARLEELAAAAMPAGSAPDAGDRWPLSVVFGGHHPDDLARIAAFESQHGERFAVEAVEVRVAAVGEVTVVADRLGDHWERYLEVPHLLHYGDLVQAIGAAGAAAKIRTGGTTPEAFPSATQLTRFLMAVTRLRVPFKATAGLHHPWRGSYPLTYEPGSARHPMFGFVNLMLATAVLRGGGDGETAQAILEEEDPAAFDRTDDAIIWRGVRIDLAELVAARHDGFRGFGSCSFREPVDELAAGVGA